MTNPFGIPFENLPPEIQEAITAGLEAAKAEHQRMHDLHDMQGEASRHHLLNFLDSLTEEQLKDLRGIMRLAHEEQDFSLYVMGVTNHVLTTTFGYCIVCNVKHEQVIEDFDLPDPPTDETDPETLMEQYNLIAVGEGFKCSKCGMTYVSLKDRMLRAPDECSGCIQTTKWG